MPNLNFTIEVCIDAIKMSLAARYVFRRFPPATLIRLYELLKNDSRSDDRTGEGTECALRFVRQVFVVGGGERDRTDDPLLAKQVLSQLSYTPECVGGSGWIRTNDPRLIKTVL
jgi:hypothetical protein